MSDLGRVMRCPYCESGPFEPLANAEGALYLLRCLRCRVVFSVAFLQDPGAVQRWIQHDRAGHPNDHVVSKTGRD